MPAPYPLEFRREAVELLKRSGKSVPELARELGVSPQSLRNWARQIDIDEGRREGLSSESARGDRRSSTQAAESVPRGDPPVAAGLDDHE